MPDEEAFERLLELSRANRSFDFTGYKRSTLHRRTQKRMTEVGVERIDDYIELVRDDPDEFTALFNTILINVTSFFRDPPTWRQLFETVVPAMVENAPDSGSMPPIRVWSAGCSSGEEAFSLAMLFAELCGLDKLSSRVRIFGTDVDEEALGQARQATYPTKALDAVPEALRDRYFDRVGTRYAVVPELRRAVIFGRHDLVRNPPISRVGLVTCRNTLMYFNRGLQDSVLRSFQFALRGGGYLCLGKSEMMITRSDRFEPVDLKRRIFVSTVNGARYDPHRTVSSEEPRQPTGKPGPVMEAALKTRAFELSEIPQLVLDSTRRVVLANARARTLFDVPADALGKEIQEFELSYRPVELRSLIDRAEADRAPAAVRAARWERGDEVTFWDVTVATLGGESVVGTMIAFVDVTSSRGMEEELQRLQREVQGAYGELQATVEELETTNEELQSTNEELETTNEELQSTNEELETMNEELQSTNEELETMNDELRQRSSELNDVNFYFESVLVSLRVGVAVTDREFQLLVWNREAEHLWGLRAEEVRGRELFGLDIGLPVALLRTSAEACLEGRSSQEVVTLDATNRVGRPVECVVTVMPLARNPEAQGVIVLMDAQDVKAVASPG